MLVYFLKLVLLGCCEQRDGFYMYGGVGGTLGFSNYHVVCSVGDFVWFFFFFLYCGSFFSLIDCIKKNISIKRINVITRVPNTWRCRRAAISSPSRAALGGFSALSRVRSISRGVFFDFSFLIFLFNSFCMMCV